MIHTRSELTGGMIAVCILCLTCPIVNAQQPESVLLGKPAPAFSLNLADGGKMSLADHRGKEIVVLDFWAIWCTHCTKRMPTMVAVTNEYKSRGVVFYA